MNSKYGQIGNGRLEKLAAEKTAFNDCRADMSDVHFEIGKNNITWWKRI